MNENEWVKIAIYLGLGVLRGITNILPIDGAAHATLLDLLVGRDPLADGSRPFTMSAILQLGSWVAILVYFRKDILVQVRKREERPSQTRKQWAGYGISIGVTLGVGLLLRSVFDQMWAEDFQSIVWLLIANGLLLLCAAWWSSTHAYGNRSASQLTWLELMLIGLIHGFGILPGISRIAVLLALGLLLGLSWFEAVRLTLILSIPTIILSVIYTVYTLVSQPSDVSPDLIHLAMGCVASGLAAWFTLRWIARTSLHSRERLPVYGIYCIAIGLFAWIVIMLPR